MKTNFQKMNNNYYAPTGKTVWVCDVQYAEDEYDSIIGEEFIDVCTGEHVAKIIDDEMSDLLGETVYQMIAADCVVEEYSRNVRLTKKDRRAMRIDDIAGVCWNKGEKQIGKNRFLRRRMMPNREQIEEFNSALPF